MYKDSDELSINNALANGLVDQPVFVFARLCVRMAISGKYMETAWNRVVYV